MQITMLSLQDEAKGMPPLLCHSSPLPPELVAGKESLQHLIAVVQPVDLAVKRPQQHPSPSDVSPVGLTEADILRIGEATWKGMPQTATTINNVDDHQDGEITDSDVSGKLILVMLCTLTLLIICSFLANYLIPL